VGTEGVVVVMKVAVVAVMKVVVVAAVVAVVVVAVVAAVVVSATQCVIGAHVGSVPTASSLTTSRRTRMVAGVEEGEVEEGEVEEDAAATEAVTAPVAVELEARDCGLS